MGEALLRIPRPVGGRYYVRVRAVDAEGFASPYGSVQPVDVRSRPPAPRLAAPADGAVVPGDAAQLSWHPHQGPASYRVQIATDARFTALVLDRRGLDGTSFRVGQTLEPGVYLWRVATTSQSDGEGAFSEARSFRVRLAPPPAGLPFWLLPFVPLLFIL